MDFYLDRINNSSNYYKAMIDASISNWTMTSEKFAGFFLKDHYNRHDYLRNVRDYCNKYQSICVDQYSSNEQKKDAFQKIQREEEIARKQFLAALNGEYTKAIGLEFKKEHGIWTYTVKTLGLIGGITQLVGGASLLYSSAFTAAPSGGATVTFGVMLIAHGSNNIYESGHFLLTGQEETGLVKDLYRFVASSAGLDKKYGDVGYASADIFLSLGAIFGKFYSPQSHLYKFPSSFMGIKTEVIESSRNIRPFSALQSDYVRGFSKMSKAGFSLEVFNDAVNFSLILDNVNT